MSKFNVGDVLVSKFNSVLYINIIDVGDNYYSYVYTKHSFDGRVFESLKSRIDNMYTLALEHVSPVYAALVGFKHEI